MKSKCWISPGRSRCSAWPTAKPTQSDRRSGRFGYLPWPSAAPYTPATTHFLAVDGLQQAAPNTELRPSERYVDNGKIITSAGISAGVDMSLYVVGRLLGKDVADETARYMQYDHWL